MNVFRNLVLLIGTNPLPNYVVSKYFIDTNKSLEKIILIHSAGNATQSSTREYAENIKNVLLSITDLHNDIFVFVPLSDIENYQIIVNNLDDGIKIDPNSCQVHLNYTGGTKYMSIHGYNYCKNKFNGNYQSSYLSARIFKLIDDEGNSFTGDLRKEVKLEFSDLIKLHGFERKNKDKNFDYQNGLIVFENIIDENKLDEYYSCFKRSEFEDSKGNLITEFNKAKTKFESNLISGVLLNVNNASPSDLKIFTEDGKFNETLNGTKNEKDKKIKYGFKFFDGDWLEEYVYKVLYEDEDLKKLSIVKNWVIHKPEWKKDNVDFEIDVILMYGYQLFGISCTTSDNKSICKSKGFEIIMRTRQIGGEESKAILITRLEEEKSKNLQTELVTDTGSNKESILVLGNEKLKKESLLKEFKNFIGDIS